MKLNNNLGLTLVEVLIAASVILIFIVALFGVHNIYLKAASHNIENVKASYLGEETLEVVRFWRDVSWTNNIANLTTGSNYRLATSTNFWMATTSTKFIDNLFDRTLSFSAVYRDSSGNIVSSGGTLDQDTRLVTATISWKHGGATSTRIFLTYITNIFNN